MSHKQSYEMDDMDYGNDGFRRSTRERTPKTSRPNHSRRRGKSPQSVNGIHRRRNRKITW